MTTRQIETALGLVRIALVTERDAARRFRMVAEARAGAAMRAGVPSFAAAPDERDAADAAEARVRSLECAETSLMAFLRHAVGSLAEAA